MKKVAENEYDAGNDGGDGNLTKVTLYAGATDTRVTTHTYDWRNRRETADGEVDRFTKRYYDNLGRVTKAEAYHTAATGTAPVGNLLSRVETKYDDRNRPYQSIVWKIDPDAADDGHNPDITLTSNTWYDAAGNAIKTQAPGKTFSKMVYDGLGRQTKSYVGYDTDETAYADASAVTGDTVVEQSEAVFDDAGNALYGVGRQRLPGVAESQTGELVDHDTQPKARVTYGATWYDGVGRPIASADYGTNADAAFTRPDTTPAASDTILVQKVDYDDAGRPHQTTDPKGFVSRTFYDDRGRPTHRVENYDGTASLWDTEPSDPKARNANVNRITAFTYHASGQQATVTAIDPDHDGDTSEAGSGGNQVTTYVYGTSKVAGSDLDSNSLLVATLMPDSDDPADLSGNGTDTVYDRVEYQYNRLGQRKSQKDPREVVRDFTFDKLGRLTEDSVTSLGRTGEDVDDAVRRIALAYDSRGNAITFTSYDAASGGNVVNEVAQAYNDFGQLEKDRQDHDSAVDTAGGIATEEVVYAYAPGSDGTEVARPTKTTYPNGRDVHYLYADAGDTNGISHVLGRVTAIASGSTRGTSDANVIAGYEHLGLGGLATKDLPGPQIKLDYVGTPGTGDGGLAMVDQFGRIKTQQWIDYSGASDADVIYAQHDYDRNSNRLHDDRQIYGSHSQVFTHDDLDRLEEFRTGLIKSDLSGIETLWTRNKHGHTLDQTSNHLAVTTPEATDQITHTANAANEYTARQTKAGSYQILGDTFSTDTSADWESTGSESVSVSGGALSLGTPADDLIDGVQEGQAQALALWGGDIGHLTALGRIKFPSGATTGRAGIVFGYKAPDDFYAQLLDLQSQVTALYRVTPDGSGGAAWSLLDSVSTTVTAGSWAVASLYGRSGARQHPASYVFADGFPSGRVGFYSDAAGVSFDYVNAVPHDRAAEGLGRWDLHGETDLSNQDLRQSTGVKSAFTPNVLRGVRVEQFELTLEMTRYDTSMQAMARLHFDVRGPGDFKYLRLRHYNTATAPTGYAVDGGGADAVVGGTGDSAEVPGVAAADPLWFRVVYDGTDLEVFAATTEAGLDTKQTAGDHCYTSSNFDVVGGRIALSAGGGRPAFDNLTLRAHRDTTGNGTPDTWVTEHIDHFTTTSGADDAEPTHDAAGNLTYDGIYAYEYDAWNRQVRTIKAYRDPGTGNVTEGSVVSEVEYDGANRRILKRVQNSADLDCTYHYYYDGHSCVEERDGSDNVLRQNV